MKILFIDNYYPDFLDKIEEGIKKDGIVEYEKIKERFFSYYFGTSNYYSKNIANLSWEADDLIINSHLLQLAWGKKINPLHRIVSFVMRNTPVIKKIHAQMGNPFILIDQVRNFRPDVIYVQCIGVIHPLVAKILKKNCKLLVGQIASKMPPDNFFVSYDLVLSSLPNIVEKINSLGVKSEYFPIGFEASILNKIKDLENEKYAVTHVGGYGPIHNERNRNLEYAAQKVNIDFWGYGESNLEKESPILKNFHGEAWGLDMYNILANSKITLTGHIKKVAGEYANNMTLFEATGCGALLIADQKSNLNELFEVGKEIVTYESPEEMVEKIEYYMSHEDERIMVAKAGQKRTLRDHTYEKRMQQLDEILKRHLNHLK